MMYLGMSQENGRAVTDVEHIQQSVSDILLTPLGSRLARRDYGSLLFELIDRPQNEVTRLQVMAASYTAISLWEPRITLNAITLETTIDGKLMAEITGTRSDGSPAALSVPIRSSQL
ncbi:baseplate assembly protein [Ewingella americana]|nr:baseplate assembly protein [Ewingella americana]